MALFNCDFFSNVLGMMSKMVVVIPENAQNRIGIDSAETNLEGGLPVLYLLHGLSDDETAWTRRTSIERYAEEKGLALVMPTTHRAFYTNTTNGYKYFDHVAREVPEKARSFFKLSDRREDNFIAGLSMGGYGAFKIATTLPENFAAAASLSGVMDIATCFDQLGDEEGRPEWEAVFGDIDNLAGSEHDLFDTTEKMLANKPLVDLYQCCGTEDFLYESNIKFRKFMESKAGIRYNYEEGPGTHNWGYWDTMIQRVIEWLPIIKNETD